MCTKLKEIQGLSPKNILNTYWDSERNVYPIDIAKMLYNMGIRIFSYDFSKFDNDDSKFVGAILTNETDITLLYRERESKSRSRFVLAHELAHCCLRNFNMQSNPHVEYYCEEISTDLHELKADMFARELLVPLKELRKILMTKYPDSLPEVVTLSEMFVVPLDVMTERLKELNVPYLDQYNRKIICIK